jgi:hypothetical protein
MRRLLAENRNAGASALHGVGLLAGAGHINRVDRAALTLGIVAAVEMFVGDVGELHRLGAAKVAPPQLDRIFKSCNDIVDYCCFNGNKLVDRPGSLCQSERAVGLMGSAFWDLA